LHQAALAGHSDVVRFLVERGVRLDLKDAIWQGTPAEWAGHEGRDEIEKFLRSREQEGDVRCWPDPEVPAAGPAGPLTLMSFVKHRGHDWNVLHARQRGVD